LLPPKSALAEAAIVGKAMAPNLSLIKTNPFFLYKGEIGKERNLITFKVIAMNSTSIAPDETFSLIWLWKGLSSIVTKLPSRNVSPSYPKQVSDYLKLGLVFIVHLT